MIRRTLSVKGRMRIPYLRLNRNFIKNLPVATKEHRSQLNTNTPTTSLSCTSVDCCLPQSGPTINPAPFHPPHPVANIKRPISDLRGDLGVLQLLGLHQRHRINNASDQKKPIFDPEPLRLIPCPINLMQPTCQKKLRASILPSLQINARPTRLNDLYRFY